MIERTDRPIIKIFSYIVIVVVSIIAIFPLYWLFITSIKPEGSLLTYPPVFFLKNINLDNYLKAFSDFLNPNIGNVTIGIYKNIYNSLFVSIGTVVITVLIGSMAAYSISRKFLSKKIRMFFLVFVLVLKIFPPITIAVPFYLLINKLNLLDSRYALIIVYIAFTLPFVIWLMLSFFQEIPKEIEEAAIIDGAGYNQRFLRIFFPLTLPGIATTAIFVFIYSWNEFLFASILTSVYAKTIPVVVAGYVSNRFLLWGEMSTVGMISVIPIIIVASIGQKFLVRGLTFGAVKE